MAFDEKLAHRVRTLLAHRSAVAEKKMFGGIAFLLSGNMCVGVHKSDLIVRLDPAATESALSKPHTRPFDLTGRPMKGWILVQPKGVASESALGTWVDAAVTYARSLPPK
jgi:hypothetical protein